METLEKGFHELEHGDNVEDPLTGGWGTVWQGGEGLVIHWAGEVPEDVDSFRAANSIAGRPYRVGRGEG